MKTRIEITQYPSRENRVHEFGTEEKAAKFFREWCDHHGYEYPVFETGQSIEAGGLGHDYLIVITDHQ